MRSLSAILPLLLACSLPNPAPVDRGVVVAPEPIAAREGARILRRGGNAVDAAVAVHFVLAVTYPRAGNLGGGGFLLVHTPRGEEALDYRETAPAAAHRDLFLDKTGKVVPELSLRSRLASGVPGSVRGMWEAHRKYGSLPWATLLEPAVRLAEGGYPLPAWQAEAFARRRKHASFSRYFRGKAGEIFRQPQLAKVLRRISRDGPDGFYRGETARLIVQEMKRGGGIITTEDLAGYRPRWRAPVVGSYKGHRIVSMPPPSSGGIALLQILNMAEAFPVRKHNSPEYVHLLAEIEKRVFADRARFLGDPDFVRIPAFLLSKTYARKRSAGISSSRKTDPEKIRHGRGESEETTHFSVVDRAGNAVSDTTTLNDSYGSGIVVEGAGFLLNNEMDDFSAKPGAPNMFGVTGGEANAVAPRKRMLSSMTPTFVFRGAKLWLVLGTPGGPTIFTTVAQVILNRTDHRMPLPRAVAAPRFHHQWPPPNSGGDWIRAETGIDLGPLRKWYRLHRRTLGDVQAVEIQDARVTGVSDPRGHGAVRYDDD